MSGIAQQAAPGAEAAPYRWRWAMLPQGLGVIRASFPPKELPAAFGAFGPVTGLSSVGGPVLAGWLISADYRGTGRRMIFLINAPIGLAAFLAGLRFLPRTQEATASRLDIVGAVLVAAAAGLLVYPVVQGRELGWPAWTFLLRAASAVVFTVFGWYEIRLQRRGRDGMPSPGDSTNPDGSQAATPAAEPA